jgi:energy-coupling factor transporter transmembrane protein EcfT
MKLLELNIDNKKSAILIFIILVILTFATSFYGSTDIGDYTDTAKLFANSYSAKIRTSHSYLFGFIMSPFVNLTNNFISFKILSLILLALLIYSTYIITNRDKKAFWLMLLSPIVWYLAPWISPIQLAALLFLWAYHFLTKYDKIEKIKLLFYSGFLIGLAWAFWDATQFFTLFIIMAFFYDKRAIHLIYFLIAIFIGLLPRLILDQYLFNFAFYTMFKNIFGIIAITLFASEVTNPVSLLWKLFLIFIFLAIIPIYFWKFYKPSLYKQNKKTMIFLTLSILFIIYNPQIRYTLILFPIIITLLVKNINKIQFRRQIVIFLILVILLINPYIIQISYHINYDLQEESIHGIEFTDFIHNLNSLSFTSVFPQNLIQEDLKKIEQEFPNQVFLVGNTVDSYNTLARSYWGKDIKEFVSLQDYNFYLSNQSTIFSKKFAPTSKIQNRRQIWFNAGISKNLNDQTNYEEIQYALTFENQIVLDNFEFVKQYKVLTIWRKTL